MLHGDTVRLRALERRDIPKFVRWFNDPDVRRNLKIIEPMSHANEERWFEAQLSSENTILGIEIQSGDGWTLIGNVGLVDPNWRDRYAELGIVIGDRDEWGKGYGSDAILTMARFAFEELNLNRLQLQVFDFNERGRRCYERCGFIHEGTRRSAVFRSGRYYDVHIMGLLVSDVAQENDGGP